MPRLTIKLHGAGRPVVAHVELVDADRERVGEALEAAARVMRAKREATRLGADTRATREPREPDPT